MYYNVLLGIKELSIFLKVYSTKILGFIIIIYHTKLIGYKKQGEL